MPEANKPVQVLRDGNLKASIFQNEGDRGPFFSTTLSCTYTDDRGKFHDSNAFSGSDLLRISELARKAYGVSRDLKQELGRSGELFKEDGEKGGRAGQDFEQSRPQARPQARGRRDLRR